MRIDHVKKQIYKILDVLEIDSIEYKSRQEKRQYSPHLEAVWVRRGVAFLSILLPYSLATADPF
jgi:hypothetical protein